MLLFASLIGVLHLLLHPLVQLLMTGAVDFGYTLTTGLLVVPISTGLYWLLAGGAANAR